MGPSLFWQRYQARTCKTNILRGVNPGPSAAPPGVSVHGAAPTCLLPALLAYLSFTAPADFVLAATKPICWSSPTATNNAMRTLRRGSWCARVLRPPSSPARFTGRGGASVFHCTVWKKNKHWWFFSSTQQLYLDLFFCTSSL